MEKSVHQVLPRLKRLTLFLLFCPILLCDLHKKRKPVPPCFRAPFECWSRPFHSTAPAIAIPVSPWFLLPQRPAFTVLHVSEFLDSGHWAYPCENACHTSRKILKPRFVEDG